MAVSAGFMSKVRIIYALGNTLGFGFSGFGVVVRKSGQPKQERQEQ